MSLQFKERIVGASVLFCCAVIVIVFISSGQRPVSSQTMRTVNLSTLSNHSMNQQRPTQAKVVNDVNTQHVRHRWFVRVASFHQAPNASLLIKRLAKHHWQARDEVIKYEKRRVYRVYLGPYNGRERALEEKSRIDKLLKVDSIIYARR